jgi:hypothetical protein
MILYLSTFFYLFFIFLEFLEFFRILFISYKTLLLYLCLTFLFEGLVIYFFFIMFPFYTLIILLQNIRNGNIDSLCFFHFILIFLDK